MKGIERMIMVTSPNNSDVKVCEVLLVFYGYQFLISEKLLENHWQPKRQESQPRGFVWLFKDDQDSYKVKKKYNISYGWLVVNVQNDDAHSTEINVSTMIRCHGRRGELHNTA